jgi:hypothetical protein
MPTPVDGGGKGKRRDAGWVGVVWKRKAALQL